MDEIPATAIKTPLIGIVLLELLLITCSPINNILDGQQPHLTGNNACSFCHRGLLRCLHGAAGAEFVDVHFRSEAFALQ